MAELKPPEPPESGASGELAAILGRITDELLADPAAREEDIIAHHPEHAEALRALLPAFRAIATLPRSTDGPQTNGVAGPSPLVCQQTLGEFRILREIGSGGMGVVYEAEQESLDRRVALKVLRMAGLLDERQLARFRNEAKAAATLHHPHIVPVFSVGCERGVHYFAMQYIDGPSLAEVLTGLQAEKQARRSSEDDDAVGEDTLPTDAETHVAVQAEISTVRSRHPRQYFRRAAEWAAQVAGGLAFAHENGVLHRDIKPGNLLLDGSGKLWIADFGLARLETDASLTLSSDLLGTLRYMSPEQALGRRVLVDQRADIYSLGVTLYELLTLRPAFDADDRQELLRQIALEEPPAPRALDPAIPFELETIVLKAIAKEPDERYLSAQDLADDLRRFLNGDPVQARRPSPLLRCWKWITRHRAPVAASLLTLLLTLSVSTVLLTRGWQRERTARQASEEHLSLARDSLDELFRVMSKATEEARGETNKDKQARLNHVAELFQRLSVALGNHELDDVQHLQAKTKVYERQAQIHDAAADHDAAEKARKRSIETHQGIVDAAPDQTRSREALATRLLSFIPDLLSSREFAEAEAALDDAQSHLETLRSGGSDTGEETQVLEVMSLSKEASLASWQEDWGRAEELVRDAIARAEDVVRRHGAKGEHLLQSCKMQLVRILAKQGRHSEAITLGERTLERCEILLRSKPTKPKAFRDLVALLHDIVGSAAADVGDLDSAESHYRRALFLQSAGLKGRGSNGLGPRQAPAAFYAAREFNDQIDANVDPGLFATYSEIQLALARVLARQGRIHEAEALLGEVWYTTENLAADLPQLDGFKSLFADCATSLGQLLLEHGRDEGRQALRAAAATWYDLMRNRPDQDGYAEKRLDELRMEYGDLLGKEAAVDWEEVLNECTENCAFYQRALGRIYLHAGYPAAAIAKFEAAAGPATSDKAHD